MVTIIHSMAPLTQSPLRKPLVPSAESRSATPLRFHSPHLRHFRIYRYFLHEKGNFSSTVDV